MGDNDTNAGETVEETVNDATSPSPTEPSAEYKGLQRKLSEKDRVIQELAARVRKLEPAPSVEEELVRERAAREALEREVALERTKAKNPDLASAIEAIVAETGKIPGEETINVLKSITTRPNTESSGLRNNPARPPQTESEKFDEILKSSKLF